MSETPAQEDAVANEGYAKALGARLRAIRMQQHLSLHGVERKSGGNGRPSWSAPTSAATARCRCSGSPSWPTSTASRSATCCRPRTARSPVAVAPPRCREIVLNLEQGARISGEGNADILRRFATSIQRQRGEDGARALSIRDEDLRTLALMYDTLDRGAHRAAGPLAGARAGVGHRRRRAVSRTQRRQLASRMMRASMPLTKRGRLVGGQRLAPARPPRRSRPRRGRRRARAARTRRAAAPRGRRRASGRSVQPSAYSASSSSMRARLACYALDQFDGVVVDRRIGQRDAFGQRRRPGRRRAGRPRTARRRPACGPCCEQPPFSC